MELLDFNVSIRNNILCIEIMFKFQPSQKTAKLNIIHVGIINYVKDTNKKKLQKFFEPISELTFFLIHIIIIIYYEADCSFLST